MNLRLPDDLHAALKAAAEADRRSLNSMIIVMIEKTLNAVPLSPEEDSPLAQTLVGNPVGPLPAVQPRRDL